MRIKPGLIGLLISFLGPVSGPVFGQDTAQAQQPLSVIEWITQRPADAMNDPALGGVLLEPPVTITGHFPTIDVSRLDQLVVPVGLVPGHVTGLPPGLWSGSDSAVLAALIRDVSVTDSPAMQQLLYTLLLSESLPPAGPDAGEILLLARVDRLLELGATDPAQALIQQAGPTKTAARFARWFDATLLTGDEDRACAALADAPHLAPGYAARIFCGARGGDWPTAALTLEVVHALELLDPAQRALLDRFLSPGMFESAPPLPLPDAPDPLTFRLFETIGERLPTASLPRAFATADLRDVAGWKAQLEAAERLTRIGALAPNHLLGLYSARRPAASGGIWDRVAALQRFETALGTGSADATAKTLPDVWAAMRQARLEVPFANLFAERLAAQPLADAAARELAWRITLLSQNYEIPARTPPDTGAGTGTSSGADGGADNAFLAALAQGDPGRVPPPDAKARAIADGFDPAARPPQAIQRLLQSGQLGEAILRAMHLLHSGAQGNPADLSGALAALRAVGMEDTARRAALQLLLLERP